jgi:hypothetical protein
MRSFPQLFIWTCSLLYTRKQITYFPASKSLSCTGYDHSGCSPICIIIMNFGSSECGVDTGTSCATRHLQRSWRMVSSRMLCRVALVRTDVSEVLSAYFIGVKRNIPYLRSVRRLLVTASVPSSPILVTLMKEALSSSETSVFTRATRRNTPEHAILHSHRRENLQSSKVLFSKRLWHLKWREVKCLLYFTRPLHEAYRMHPISSNFNVVCTLTP